MPLKLRRTVMIWKTLTTIAAATSLAMAQAQGSSGPDGMSAAAAADNPPAPKHHKKMYMSAKHKKGSQKTGTNGGY
jgi:hypothetical protein